MHSQHTAQYTLNLIWRTYGSLFEQLDPERSDPADSTRAKPDASDERDMRVALWQCRLGYVLSSWVLWENYARQLCDQLPKPCKRKPTESFPAWVDRSFTVNGRTFENSAWFANANGLRNLIVHYGARVTDTTGKTAELQQQAYNAFPQLGHSLEGYVMLEDDHVATVCWNIGEFVAKNPLPQPATS